MANYDGWEILRENEKEKILGSGGQGTVYLARSPERSLERTKADALIRGSLQQITSGKYKAQELAGNLSILAGPDPICSLGALKQFKIPADDKGEEVQALGRLESEIQALNSLRDHPAV